MESEQTLGETLLSELCKRLTISTEQWTTAATDTLRAVAAPRRRSDGRWAVVVHVQRAVPEVPKDLFKCILQIKDHPELRASVTPDGRLDLGPLDSGETTLELFDVSGRLAKALREASDSWQSVGAKLPDYAMDDLADNALDLAASGDAAPIIWEWESDEGLLSASATRDQAGLQFFFRSPEAALGGREIEIRSQGPGYAHIVLEGKSSERTVFSSCRFPTNEGQAIRFVLRDEN